MRVVIPSHRRASTLRDRTLRYLLSTDYSGALDVLITDPGEEAAYRDVVGARGDVIVIPEATSATKKFNAIHRRYPVGEEIFVIEDDVDRIVVADSPHTNRRRTLTELTALIAGGFSLLGGTGLFGIAPHGNSFYFSGRVKRGLYLVVAHAYGFVSNHDDRLAVTLPTKTDYERTLRYFVNGYPVVRIDAAGPVAHASYTGAGGIQADADRSERSRMEDEAVEALCREFPGLARRKEKRTSPFAEMELVNP